MTDLKLERAIELYHKGGICPGPVDIAPRKLRLQESHELHELMEKNAFNWLCRLRLAQDLIQLWAPAIDGEWGLNLAERKTYAEYCKLKEESNDGE